MHLNGAKSESMWSCFWLLRKKDTNRTSNSSKRALRSVTVQAVGGKIQQFFAFYWKIELF
jgi:hypothetical protein